jgi:DNA-binding FrmR family transcriptional regulator
MALSSAGALTGIGGYPIYVTMAHTIREKKKLLARVGRIRGQIEAIERALSDEAECERVMHLIAGVRGSVAGLMAEVLEDHIRTHLVDSERNPDALNADAADQLIEVVHTYLK